ELGARVGVENAAPSVEDGSLGGGDSGCGFADLAWVSPARRPPAGEIDRLRILEVELSLLDVTGNVDQHRPAATGACDVERSLDRVGQLLDVFHEPRVLDDRDRSEEHTSELQSRGHLVCRLLLEKKKSTVTPVFSDSS